MSPLRFLSYLVCVFDTIVTLLFVFPITLYTVLPDDLRPQVLPHKFLFRRLLYYKLNSTPFTYP